MVRNVKVNEEVRQTYDDFKKLVKEQIDEFKSTPIDMNEKLGKPEDTKNAPKQNYGNTKEAADHKHEKTNAWMSQNYDEDKDKDKDKNKVLVQAQHVNEAPQENDESMTEKVKDVLSTTKDKIAEVGEKVWDALPSWEEKRPEIENVADNAKITYEDTKIAEDKADHLHTATASYLDEAKEKMLDVSNRASETANEARETIGENYDQAKQWMGQKYEEAKDKMVDTKEAAQENAQSMGERITVALTDMKEYLVGDKKPD